MFLDSLFGMNFPCFLIAFLVVLSQSFDVSSFSTTQNFKKFRTSSSSKTIRFSQTPANEEVQESTGETTYFSPNRPLREGGLTEEDGLESIDIADVEGSTNEYSFFDEATIYVRAGSGGQGSSTYKKGVGGQNGPPGKFHL